MATKRITQQTIGSETHGHFPAGAVVALLSQTHRMIERAGHALAAQKERISILEDIAQVDELTGLKNAQGFRDALGRELDRCQRGFAQGGILLSLELENSAMIYKKYGPGAAYACLRLVALTLSEGIRVMDVAGRLGHDEFILLLSHTTRCDAAARAQKLAWQLNKLALAWNGEEIPVQVSLALKPYEAGDRIEKFFGHDGSTNRERPMNS